MYEFSKLSEGGFSQLTMGIDRDMDIPIAIKYVNKLKNNLNRTKIKNWPLER